MITVKEALQLGKEIYTFPHPFESAEGSGCNPLIDDGAKNPLHDWISCRRSVQTLIG